MALMSYDALNRLKKKSGPSAGQAGSAAAQLGAGNVVQSGLNSVPNVSVTASATVAVAVETPTASTTLRPRSADRRLRGLRLSLAGGLAQAFRGLRFSLGE